MKHLNFLYRCIGTLLSAACLAACGAAPAATSAAPQSGSVAAVQSAPAAGAYQMLRGPWGNTCDSPLYLTEVINRDTMSYNTCIDLRTAQQRYLCSKQGCTHSDSSCEACRAAYSGTPQNFCNASILTQDSIYWADGSQDFPAHLYKSGLDGADKTLLFSLGDEVTEVLNADGSVTRFMKYQWDGTAFATDGAYYYQAVRVCTASANGGALSFTSQLWKIDPATDTHEVLYETAPDTGMLGQTLLLGCTNDALILDELTEPADTGSLSANVKAAQHSVFLLARDGTKTPVLQYKAGDYAGSLVFYNTLYAVSPDTTTLQAIDLVTGEVKTITQALPASEFVSIGQPYDGTAYVSTFSNADADGPEESVLYSVSLTTGEIVPIQLLYYHNGHTVAPTILAATESDYLVVMEEKPIQYASTGSDGAPMVIDSSYALYALLSKEDYRASNPNYREIAMLPQ
ncbi:MAG: hypothetical protein RSD27_07805 [Ruthenibacterium sp.]